MLSLSFSGICSECGKYKRALKEHLIYSHRQGNIYYCDLCPKYYKGKYQMNIHMINQHIKPENRPMIDCPICGTQFQSFSARNLHKETVHIGYNLTCHECGQLFASKRRLREHIKGHKRKKDDPKLQCDICSRFFCNKYEVIKHKRRIHEVPRSFVCTFEGCKMDFITQGDLNKHLLFHKGNRKVEMCSWPGCGKPFLKTSKLRNHYQYVHQNYRIRCPVEGCNYAIGRRDHMRQHIEVMHNSDEAEKQRYLQSVKGLKMC